jgi:hypothetical protein
MMKNIFKLKNLYLLIAVVALAYGGYYFGTQNTENTTSNKTLELTTVSIQKGDLEKKEEYNGTLRQTDSKVLNSPMSGVVTYVPKEGTVISFGEVLFAVDNKPVILLEGTTPFYRTLDLNSNPGPDVLQLEEALIYLGYAQKILFLMKLLMRSHQRCLILYTLTTVLIQNLILPLLNK